MSAPEATTAALAQVGQREPSASAADVARTTDRRARMLRFLEAYALLGLLICAALFFSLWSKTSATFFTSANLNILVANQAVVGIVALGALVPLVCNQFDLSVGATAGVSAVYVATAMSSGTAVVPALLLGVGIGVVVGLVNGLLVTRASVNGVVTTLAMSTILAGVVTQKTGGLSVAGNIPASVTGFGTGTTLGVPRVALALVVVALFVYHLLEQTPIGRQIYAYGSNSSAASLVGIRTKLVLCLSFVLAGLLSAVAGAIYVARAGGVDPQVGPGFALPALAAAFLSAAAIKPGRYNVGGTLVAIFFLAVLNNGLNLAGAQPYVASYVNGLALIVGVGLAVQLSRRRS